MTRDKQLQNIDLDHVLEKRRLDQALNVKEFAVLADISYSTARGWFRLPGFPAVRNVVFWEDVVRWRRAQIGRHDGCLHRTQDPTLRVFDGGLTE